MALCCIGGRRRHTWKLGRHVSGIELMIQMLLLGLGSPGKGRNPKRTGNHHSKAQRRFRKLKTTSIKAQEQQLSKRSRSSNLFQPVIFRINLKQLILSFCVVLLKRLSVNQFRHHKRLHMGHWDSPYSFNSFLSLHIKQRIWTPPPSAIFGTISLLAEDHSLHLQMASSSGKLKEVP